MNELLNERLNALEKRIDKQESYQRKIEANIADRLGKLIASGFTSEFIRNTILNAEPNYPHAKDDPDMLSFDKAVDDAMRAYLRTDQN